MKMNRKKMLEHLMKMNRKKMLEHLMKMNRKKMLDLLRKNDIHQVSIYYAGSGDEGMIESVHFQNGTGRYTEMTESLLRDMFTGDVDVLYNFFYDLLEQYVCGFEINEGGYGNFNWDIATNRLMLNHTEITHSEQYREIKIG